MDIEILERNLERQLAWIRSAETRLSLILPLGTVLFGVISAKLGDISAAFSVSALSAWASLALVSASMFFAALSVFPRTNGPMDSVIFFGSISNTTADEYSHKIHNADQTFYKRDLINQIHRNAEIATQKHILIRRSLIALFFCVPFWGFAASSFY